MAVSKEEILDTIANMSVLDVVDLIKAMEDKFGVSAAAPVAMAAAAAAPAAAAVEEQSATVKEMARTAGESADGTGEIAGALSELAALPRQRRFGKDKSGTLSATCRACKWRFACNGGCPKHRTIPEPGGGPGRVNHFCAGYRMFLDHAAPALGRMAQLIHSGRPAAAIMTEAPPRP